MTDHLPPQQELEKLLSGIIKLHYSEIVTTTKTGTRPTETIADLTKLISQTRTDTIREVEELLPDNPQDWLKESIITILADNSQDPNYRQYLEKNYAVSKVKVLVDDVQARFTAQAKQHQIELLRTRIKDLQLIHKTIVANDVAGPAKWLVENMERSLQAELAKLKGQK